MSGSADPTDLAIAQAPSYWPTATKPDPKPYFADDIEQASYMRCIHTWLLTPYKAISFDKLTPRFEVPSPPATWRYLVLAFAVPCRTPPESVGSVGLNSIALYFPCLRRCTGKEQDTGASSPQACDQIISPSVTHPNHHSWRSCQQY